MSQKLPEPQTLGESHVKTICRPGSAETCSFLMFDASGFICAKGSGYEDLIKNRRASQTMTAMGDNCSGPPEFEREETKV